jgi:hypothetical protein
MSNKIYFKDYYNGLEDTKIKMIKSNYEKINDLPEKYSSLNMNLNYDGRNSEADVIMDINKNGQKKHYNFNLDKDDLEKILNYPTNEKSLEERLKDDLFNRVKFYETEYPKYETLKNSENQHTCHVSPEPCFACRSMENQHTCHVSPEPCFACQKFKNPKSPLAVVEIDYKEPPQPQIIPIPFCPTSNNNSTQNHLHYHVIHKQPETSNKKNIETPLKKKIYKKKIKSTLKNVYINVDSPYKNTLTRKYKKNKKTKRNYIIKIPKSLYKKINRTSTKKSLKPPEASTMKPTIILDDIQKRSPNKSIINKTITQINK